MKTKEECLQDAGIDLGRYSHSELIQIKEGMRLFAEEVVTNCNTPAVVGQSEQLICRHCGKYKRMQGNGIMHQLCECGE